VFNAQARIGTDAPPTLAAALETAYNALDRVNRDRADVALDVHERLSGSFSKLVGGGLASARITCRHERRGEQVRLVGLSYLPPPGPRTTERRIDILLREGPAEGNGARELWAGVRVRARHPGDATGDGTAPEYRLHAPAPWRALGDAYGFDVEDFPLTADSSELDRDAVEATLVPLLLNERRAHPVFIFSPLQITSTPILDAAATARALYGACTVHVLTDRRATFPLAEAIGASFACYDGAARLYRPGLSSDDPPGRHPLWKPDEQMAANDFPRAVFHAIGKEPHTPGPTLEWSILSDPAIGKLVGSVEGEELIRLLRDRESDAKSRIVELESALADERDRSRSLEDRVQALRRKLAVHEPDADLAYGARGDDDRDSPAAEVVKRVVGEFGNRLVLSPNNRSELNDSPYEDLDGLEAAVRFLATTYWDARFGEHEEPDLDAALRAVAPGFSYRPHQSPSTMGNYAADYETLWEGRRYSLRYHLARGTSRDARRTIRIGFAVDEERQVVVLGFIGQHQRTRQS